MRSGSTSTSPSPTTPTWTTRPTRRSPMPMRQGCRASRTTPASRSPPSAGGRACEAPAGAARTRWRASSRRFPPAPIGRRGWCACSPWRFPAPAAGAAVETFTGIVEGTVAETRRGSGGFGYDPVFLLPRGVTTAELSEAEKDAVSHRGRAVAAALPRLREVLSDGLAHRSLSGRVQSLVAPPTCAAA